MKTKLTLAVITFALICAPQSRAAVKQWKGSVNGDWNNAGNWTNNAVPVSGDDLVFPSSAVNQVNTNTLTSLRLNSISIGAGTYTIRGNAITLTNGIILSANTANTIAFGLTLGAPQNI